MSRTANKENWNNWAVLVLVIGIDPTLIHDDDDDVHHMKLKRVEESQIGPN